MSQVAKLAKAFDTFIKGCKADGTWDSIKASCVMAGWDGLDGALTPLVGTAPTNYNFASGDYNRETGLIGNGTTKCLDANRAGNADPQNNLSFGTYITTAATTGISIGTGGAITGSSLLGAYSGVSRNQTSTAYSPSATGFVGFFGTSRSNSTGYEYRRIGAQQTITQASQTPYSVNFGVFAFSANTVNTDARQSFYWIGEALDLAALDTRVSNLMTDIAAAIP